MSDASTEPPDCELLDLQKILAERPPGMGYENRSLFRLTYKAGEPVRVDFPTTPIKLYCNSDDCQDFTFFDCHDGPITMGYGEREQKIKNEIINFNCRHCRANKKTYALKLYWLSAEKAGIFKIGELPGYGPHTPTRLISLMGKNKDLFLKGRRCESQGLGIGAFSYYRRVVENIKDRLIDEIIKVSRIVDAPAEIIRELEQVKQEGQFAKAIDKVKPAVPETLKIGGHNPLTLLHAALSEGLHNDTDDNCLEVAESIRMILAELSEKMAAAVVEKKDVTNALAKLLKKAAEKKTNSIIPDV